MICVGVCIGSTVQAHAAATVNYLGPLWTDTSEGKVRVGHFTVNGKTAFCMEHSKESPPTGTSLSEKVYRNTGVRKILYYGWEGPGQWKGFSGMKQGITLTSLLLSEVYSKAQPVGTYNFVPGLVEFRKFVNGQPAPSVELKFSRTVVSSYYDGAIDAERSESIDVTGTGGSLTVTVPEGCLLVRDDSDVGLTGEVTLEAGDSFYIRSEGQFSEVETSEVKGRGYTLQPLVYVTASTGMQDLTRLDYVQDAAESTRLTINWQGRPELIITKIDADTGRKLSGATFALIEMPAPEPMALSADDESESNTGGDDNGEAQPPLNSAAELRAALTDEPTYTTGLSGKVQVADRLLPGHFYCVVETKAPNGYSLSDEVGIIDFVEGDTEIEFANSKQRVYIILDKKGEKDGKEYALEGAVFSIKAAEDIRDWGSDEVLYRAGEEVIELTTDVDGRAETEAMPPGKYTVQEIEAPDGYILDGEVHELTLVPAEDKAELRYTYTSVNYPEKPVVDVPDTGDETNLKMLLMLTVILAVCITAADLILIKRCRER
ncbi:MAG: SpaA isopeptide-forming pilin-related protein [Firmicutes bacterium]|nr:SpaA isopeptide-forming pilin-related protein [Bacillota bacterium]